MKYLKDFDGAFTSGPKDRHKLSVIHISLLLLFFAFILIRKV